MKIFQLGDILARIDSGQYQLTRNVFLRLLGFVYFCAFASLWVQVDALIGSDGLLPIANFLREAKEHLPGLNRYHRLPTLSWFAQGDWFLIVQCAAGAILSVVLMAGFIPMAALSGLWILWLSLVIAGQEFLAFQWDALLLETGFLAIFFAPLGLRLRTADAVPGRILWLFRWLLFRLMFLSGSVKLLSGDPSWSNFTALFYHYETQPLPTVFGWMVYQLPSWFLVLQTGVMYIIELVVPFCIFLPRRARAVAFVLLVLLQIGIALTGNYCYFNLLTIVLCVLLLDDAALRRFIPRKWKVPEPGVEMGPGLEHWPLRATRIRTAAINLVTALVLVITAIQLVSTFTAKQNWGRSVTALYRLVEPFRSINTYGLFAVMTKTRHEIIIEGSMDGENWLAYEFKYKPGNLKQRPKFVAPHQPRLDWQMWFAALGKYEQNRWFTSLCLKLLQGEPKVISLLESNPFPNKPPQFIRALNYEYEFTNWQTLRSTGEWWSRGDAEVYLPTVVTR